MTQTPRLTFGAFPLGAAGMAYGVATGPPDDFERIEAAITDLAGPERLESGRFLVRSYVGYTGPASCPAVLSQIEQLLQAPVTWDLVLCFRYGGNDLSGWLGLIDDLVKRFGCRLGALQITGEANMPGAPDGADGAQPLARQALVQGVLAAREAVDASGANVDIGFAVTPTFDLNEDFWPEIARLGGDAFGKAVDYAGIDFYLDVFGPRIPAEHVPLATRAVLHQFRHRDLAMAGIPTTVPIRICEGGWPTSSERPYEQQAQMLDLVIRSIASLASDLNITHYELFALRDADSGVDDIFYQFGVLRDDYTPKPAYDVFKRLIRELG